ncbi:hypothetical protein S1361_34410 [Streptomyces cyanogenus]|uniref:N-acetyltransferase domain-containing protein n=1 Tax=Streptomyces cyanogenus TaxID=80860 RepID=A0ABX7U0B5_STRCY|nr:hypothetical protein S1361_34410 [Streptomyces cyanogenus]
MEAVGDGEVVGRIDFVPESPARALVPVHTIVEPDHAGKGIGGSLAREPYALAEREGVPVAPLCPYVVKWAERHAEPAPPAGPTLQSAAKNRLRAPRAGSEWSAVPEGPRCPTPGASRRPVPCSRLPPTWTPPVLPSGEWPRGRRVGGGVVQRRRAVTARRTP